MNCTRCECPVCVAERERVELERFLLWKMVELLIFEASHARGINTKANVFIKAWEKRPIKKPTV